MKALMTGGGTGGHLYPALAVADALKKMQKEVEILFVGSIHGIESREVPEAGYPFRGLDTRGFPRRAGLRAFGALWALARAIAQARKIMRELRPQVVFSTGGYASAPVVVAAYLERLPLVLHEQNSVPGLTNRIASRVAAEVHLAFASARRFFPRRSHLRLSGNPLREQVTTGNAGRALRLFRLDENRTTVLVFGGSQGAHSINEALLAALPTFEGREELQFLIQSGNDDYDRILARCRDLKVKTWVRRFISNMGDAYALADLVVCRAGAMTVSELAACGLPSILIPYPYATGNHQRLNAEQMAEAGAAVIISDSELNGARLAHEVDDLLTRPKRLREMSVNALRMARPEATDKIARALLRFRPASEIPAEPEPSRRPDYRSRGQAPRKVGPSRAAMGGRGGRSGSRRNGSGHEGRNNSQRNGGSGGGSPGRGGGPPQGGEGRRSDSGRSRREMQDARGERGGGRGAGERSAAPESREGEAK